MKIVKLKIKNIASIENADIDFESAPLGESPLFLICGETGSGKTTILDAITLALYGKTPRYAGGNNNNNCQVGGMAFNDMRQLVRRGASNAQAVVELVGNDGKTYEACWSVDVYLRGANKGNLRDPQWIWKDRSSGGVTYDRVNDIRELSKAAIGLGFEQFCRTTLLAQGQFTKFLLGNEDEKAEILEKLTDTEKFKEIGVAIARKYANLEEKAETLTSEVNRLEGLGRERPNVEKKIKDLVDILAVDAKRLEAMEAQRAWLDRNEVLAQSEQKVRADLSAAFATLKATEAEMATRRSEALEEVGRIEKYLAGNAAKAEMLGCAGVILAELGHVRDARAKKAAGEMHLAQFKAQLPELETARKNAAGILDTAKKNYDQEAAREEYEKRALEAMKLGQLRKDKDAAVEKIGKIEALRVRMEGLGRLRCDMELHKKNLEERKSELESKRQVLPGLEKALNVAFEKRNAAQEERDKVMRLLDNGIERIVAGLQVGDECPVCKSRIESLNTEEVFSELMAEKNCAYAAADRTFRNAEISFNAAKAALDGAGKSVAEAESQIAADRDNYKKASAEIHESAKLFGIAGDIESADAALKSIREKISALEAEIAKGEKQESVVAEIALSLRRLQRAMAKAAEDLSVEENRCRNCEAAIREAERGIKAEEDRAAMSFDNAAAKISDAGWQEAWSANPGEWESRLKEEAAEYVRRRDALPSAKARLEGCAKLAGQITEYRKRALEKVPGLEASTGDDGIADERAPVLVENLLGQFALLDRQRREHAENKPSDLTEEDSTETLTVKCAELKTEDDRLRNELAAERRKLADDDKCTNDRAAKEKELEAVRAMRDEWYPVSRLLGDQNGRRIQRAIQSYVLMNVLGKANYYLRQLSSRYELSCEGLVLTVVDANEGGVVRPVNTLSGGEQFLVSLALALGLAGMNDTGVGVDMLMIDEGFGTLSGEHLNSAIEALERLNALTGTRKVGVISHVERLRERIKTHIEVSRNGLEPSTVRVCSATR